MSSVSRMRPSQRRASWMESKAFLVSIIALVVLILGATVVANVNTKSQGWQDIGDRWAGVSAEGAQVVRESKLQQALDLEAITLKDNQWNSDEGQVNMAFNAVERTIALVTSTEEYDRMLLTSPQGAYQIAAGQVPPVINEVFTRTWGGNLPKIIDGDDATNRWWVATHNARLEQGSDQSYHITIKPTSWMREGNKLLVRYTISDNYQQFKVRVDPTRTGGKPLERQDYSVSGLMVFDGGKMRDGRYTYENVSLLSN